MPAGSLDRNLAKALRELSQKFDWSAAQVARELGLERTLVWRAMNEKPITEMNAARLRIAIERISIGTGSSQSIAYATELLRYLLCAVEAFEADHAVRTRRAK